MRAGQRNPKTRAELARGGMRAKAAVLAEALTGHFEDDHGLLPRSMPAHIDTLSAQIDDIGERIEVVIAPFTSTVARLDEITGVGGDRRSAAHRRDRRGRHPENTHIRQIGAGMS